MTPSPFGKHQKAITRLAEMLLNELDRVQCEDCEVAVAVDLDWIIDTDLVVRPDISLCCGSSIDKYIESPPKFIAEVLSQSTQIKDRTAWCDRVTTITRLCDKHRPPKTLSAINLKYHRLAL